MPILSTMSGLSARAFGFGYQFKSSAYEHIETQTVGSGGAASVTFSSIAGTYKHLQIRGRWIASGANSNVRARCNGDTGNNYVYHAVSGDGTSATSFNATSQPWAYISFCATNKDAAFVLDILDYASTTKNKTFRNLTGCEVNGVGGSTALVSNLWLNSSTAISSITLPCEGGTFAQHSTFSLYGVK